jgi:hypothetical protein
MVENAWTFIETPVGRKTGPVSIDVERSGRDDGAEVQFGKKRPRPHLTNKPGSPQLRRVSIQDDNSLPISDLGFLLASPEAISPEAIWRFAA